MIGAEDDRYAEGCRIQAAWMHSSPSIDNRPTARFMKRFESGTLSGDHVGPFWAVGWQNMTKIESLKLRRLVGRTVVWSSLVWSGPRDWSRQEQPPGHLSLSLPVGVFSTQRF